jgi:hypothetical protein
MGVRLVRGREFSQHDDESAPNVVMVNEMLARRCSPGEDVIAKPSRRVRAERSGAKPGYQSADTHDV